MSIIVPGSGSPFGIAWGFLYGYCGATTESFMPLVRGLGAGSSKVYLFWNQIEPEKGRFQWDAVDAFVHQLNSPEEGLISLFSTSTWAVQRPGIVLPPSPAKDPDDYYRFVKAVVTRCQGRVRYWQNDSEPNNPVYWAGTKEEFAAALKIFYKAVKEADPSAVVVAGGYDGLFNPPAMYPIPGQEKGLAFFDYVLKESADAFDVFDLRLYADPYLIPWRVDYIRSRMRASGYERPIIATEYNGPGFYDFAPNWKYAPLIFKWMEAIAAGHAGVGQNEVAELYDRMDQLSPQTQMFMQGCSPELQAKLERMQARDLVIRNVLALSAGVQRILYWALRTDTPDRHDVMNLMYGKMALLGYEDGVLRERSPLAHAYRQMAYQLAGVESVTGVDVPGHPSIFLFQVSRRGRPRLHIVWERRDAFTGEDDPATQVTIADGRISCAVSISPAFIEDSI